jgi:hypothetical protein
MEGKRRSERKRRIERRAIKARSSVCSLKSIDLMKVKMT